MPRHNRDMLALLDRVIESDSYGVPGSDFVRCRICDCENGPGKFVREDWHKEWCPVPRLQRKYQDKKGGAA